METTEANLDPDNPLKEYTGVWIPREVMECPELSATDKIAYGELASFNVCYASNAWLAKRIAKSEWTARQCVSKLKRLGFVEEIGFNGRFRKLRVNRNPVEKSAECGKNSIQSVEKSTGRVLENPHPEGGKIHTIDKSKEKRKEQSKSISTKVEIGQGPVSGGCGKSLLELEPESYGNEKINEMFLLWEKMFGYKQKNSKANRYACANMLRAKDKGEQWLVNTMKILRESSKDRYAGKEVSGNADFSDLQRNCDKIWMWGRKTWEGQQQNEIVNLADL